MSEEREPSSFRDPAGFLYWKDGVLFRQVSSTGKDDYELYMSSGLYDTLSKSGKVISHREASHTEMHGRYKTLEPEHIPFISYPYEWSFSALKDAALLTLDIQKTSLEHGMSLKDASAYNIQFRGASPVLIDTLSFEKYEEGRPWIAYRQFCQHFLAPLALMAYTDTRLVHLMRSHLDGVPLDLASSLLPFRTKLKPSLLAHLHIHASSQKRYADKAVASEGMKVSKFALQALIDSLESAIHKLKLPKFDTEWGDYYDTTNYTKEAFDTKKNLVTLYLERTEAKNVWDIGANTGVFSEIASSQGKQTISMDIDPLAVERNYLQAKKRDAKNLLPLLIDITNPTPAIGWAGKERSSLIERGPTDAVLALALVHHLAISHNLPLEKIAEFFSDLSKTLIIEFVPKDDSQVKRLLASREDIFSHYTKEGFEQAFGAHFEIMLSDSIEGSLRTLYLMKRK